MNEAREAVEAAVNRVDRDRTADGGTGELESGDVLSRSTSGFQRFRKNRIAVIGLASLMILFSVALSARWLTRYDPIDQALSDAFQPPGRAHVFGTDHFGRDIFSRVMYGSRVSFAVALGAVSTALLVSLPIGLSSAYFGGKVDVVMTTILDSLLTFPPILLAIALVAALGSNLTSVVAALAIVRVPRFGRLLRGSALAVREKDYVLAARATGASDARIMFRHILPNAFGPLTVESTVSFADAIITEASLSFLGIGVQPPTPSWGRDLSEARRYLEDAPWVAIFVTLMIMWSVLSVNFIGDGMRDALDPRVDRQS